MDSDIKMIRYLPLITWFCDCLVLLVDNVGLPITVNMSRSFVDLVWNESNHHK